MNTKTGFGRSLSVSGPTVRTVGITFGGVFVALISLLLMSGCAPDPVNPQSQRSFPGEYRAMNSVKLGALIRQIDPHATLTENTWRFTTADHVIAVIYDESADRMRILIPITSADEISADQRTRMLQANFDSALDARYAIAQDLVWATFIHPLSPLTDNEFLLGLGQTISIVETFGDTYSSGMFTFAAGDSAEIQRKRFIDLFRKQTT